MSIVDSSGNKINSDRGEIPMEFAMPNAFSSQTEEERMIISPILDFATTRPAGAITDMNVMIPKNDYIHPEQKIDDTDFKKLLMEGELEYLDLSNCYNINDFRDLGFQTSLKQLSLVGCSQITNGNFLRGLRNLEVLDISGTGIIDLSFVEELPNLKVLCMRYTNVRDLSPVSKLGDLRDLVVIGCHTIGNFSGLENLKELRLFDGYTLTKLHDISFISNWTKLEELYLDHCKPDSLEPIRELYNLKVFSMNRYVPRDAPKDKKKLRTLISGVGKFSGSENKKTHVFSNNAKQNFADPLKDLTNLRFLDLRNTGINNIKPLEKLTKMNSLDLGYGNFLDISPLSGMKEMRKITIDEMVGTFDLSPLENMKELLDCDISGIRAADISVLKNFTKIEVLDLNGNILVHDLSPIENLTDLVYLDISGCLMIDDLYYIRKLKNLLFLLIQGNPRIKSAWPVREMEKMFLLNISATSIPRSEIAEFKRLGKLAKFFASSTKYFHEAYKHKRAVIASKRRKKINSFRKKLQF